MKEITGTKPLEIQINEENSRNEWRKKRGKGKKRGKKNHRGKKKCRGIKRFTRKCRGKKGKHLKIPLEIYYSNTILWV